MMFTKSNRPNKWMIFSVAVLAMMTDFALLFSFGAIYVEMMDTYKVDRATAVTVQSLLVGIGLVFGMFSGALITTIGLPAVTLIASILVPGGLTSSFFATNIYILYITIGTVSAVGISMVHISSFVVIGRVFKGRQQLLCITILNTTMGIASIGYPYLLSWLATQFGLPGTFLILGGLTCNTFLLSIVCFINRTAINDEKGDNNRKAVNNENVYDNQKGINEETAGHSRKDVNERKEYHNRIPIIEETADQNRKVFNKDNADNSQKPINDDNSDNNRGPVNVENAENNRGFVHDEKEHNIIKSLNDEQSDNLHALGNTDVELYVGQKTCFNKVLVLCKKLMTKPYICLVLGYACGNASLLGYLGAKMDIALSKGLTAREGLSSFLAFNCCNIVSRLIPGLLKRRRGINSFFYPVFSSLSGFCGQLLIYFSTQLTMYMVGVCLSGISYGGIVSSTINTIVRIASPDQEPLAIGFLFSVIGILLMGIGPLFGAIRDISGSYGSVLLTISVANAFSAVFYLSAMIFRKREKKAMEIKISPNTTSVFTVSDIEISYDTKL